MVRKREIRYSPIRKTERQNLETKSDNAMIIATFKLALEMRGEVEAKIP